MRNIIKNLGSITLLTCLSLILLTGCSRKSQLKLAIEMANYEYRNDRRNIEHYF